MKRSLSTLIKILILGTTMYFMNGCKDNYELAPETGFYKDGSEYIGFFERDKAQVNNLVVLTKDLKTAYIYKDMNNNLYLDDNEFVIKYGFNGFGYEEINNEDENFANFQKKFEDYISDLEEIAKNNGREKLEKEKSREIVNELEVMF